MRHSLVLIATFLSFVSLADNGPRVEFRADLLSRHYWRGFVLGETPAFEPQVTFTSGRFSVNFWTATTFDNSYSEVDIIPALTFGNYTLSLYDYYNPEPGGANRYFLFSGDENRHSGELAVDYNGEGWLPLNWMIAVFVYGDRHPEQGHSQFSTFMQLGYNFPIAGFEASVSAAISPWIGYYSPRTALVHTGASLAKTFSMAKGLSLPLNLSVAANPHARQMWVIASAGISWGHVFRKKNLRQYN